MLARWDTFFYYTIATDGYSWDPAVFRHYNVVFFPLYPMLMRWGGAALGAESLLAGLVISLTAFAGALVLVYRLAQLELGDDYGWRVILLDLHVSVRVVLLRGIHRVAVSVPGSVGAFYAMRRGRLGLDRAVRARGRSGPAEWIRWHLLLALLAIWPLHRGASDAGGWRPVSLSLALLVAAVPVVGVTIFSSYLQLAIRRPAGLGAWTGGVGRAADAAPRRARPRQAGW